MVHIGNEIVLAVPLVELAVQFRQEDNREFQALALMHAQNAHGVAGRRGRFGRRPVLAGVLELLDERDETRQRGNACAAGEPLELHGPVVQLEQIGLASLAAGQGTNKSQVLCVMIKAPEQIGQVPSSSQSAPAFERRKGPAQFVFHPRIGAGIRIPHRTGMEIRLGQGLASRQADGSQLRLVESEERTAQHRRQLDIPLWIVEHLEQAEHIADLRRLEVAGRRITTDGNARQAQHLDIIVGLLRQRTHQHDDVTILHIAQASRLRVGNLPGGLPRFGTDELLDPPGNQHRLALPGPDEIDPDRYIVGSIALARVVPVVRLLIEDVQFDDRRPIHVC